MLPNPMKLLRSPLTDLLSGVASVVDKFTTSPEERLKAQQELLRIEREFHGKYLDFERTLAESRASIITAEANSENKLASSWRPLLMYLFILILGYNYLFYPLIGVHLDMVQLAIPPKLWDLLEIGLGGYIVGRSVEKTVPSLVAGLRNSKDS